MKIVLILTSIEVGTIEKVSYNLYKALSNINEVELHVVNLKSSEKDFYRFENLYNIKECRSGNFAVRQIYNLKKVYKLYKIKSLIKPDISITTQEAGTTINLLSFGSEKKIGIFHAPYYQSKSEGKISFYFQFLSYKFLYSKLNAFFCVSKEIKNSISNKFSINDAKLRVVYNVHDFEEIRVKSEEQLPDEEEFLFDGKSIIYVGRFDANKAPNRLIESFYELKKCRKIDDDVKLIFIGSGEENFENYLKNLVLKLDLYENVFFLGFKSNPYKYIKKSTILVSSSFSEGLPGVVIESIFLKTPVVTTNSSLGLWEILDCDNNYDFLLNDIYVANNGIITSNLMESDSENKNIMALNKAIDILINDEKFYNQIKNNDFDFMKLLDEKKIVKNFFQI
ncbi:glycosyltransferase [Flavobacterium daemonense]|uniref:glycosyltransferase n=1 Tax=Flavobacterium daemonense TaxID=1393049 RepID=UPI0011850BF7|nr:glycosyltransferase [Flavobacterium daemonense]KAF2333147.1 glycosyltransferase [Flavobacterium daemonense]